MQKVHQTFVIDDFPGLFDGTTLTRLPPGAMIAGRSGSESKARTLNVQLSEDGELRNSGFYSRVCSLTADQISTCKGIFWWKAPTGGDWLLLVAENKISVLAFIDPNIGAYDPFFREIPTTTYFQLITTKDRNFGMFETFGDACYYCDGSNVPARITYSPSHQTLHPVPMGTGWTKEELVGYLDIEYKRYAALGGPVSHGSAGGYYVTAVTPYGESPPTIITLDTTVGVYSPSEEGIQGPVGISNVLTFDWSQVDPEIYRANIYRVPEGGSVPQMVGYVTRRSPTFLDCYRDNELGIPLPTNLGLPSRFRLIRAYGDRMFAVGGYSNPNRISFSELGYPDVWPPQYELSTIDIGRSGNITQMEAIGGHLYFFYENSFSRLIGSDALDFSLEVVSTSIGCIAPRSMSRWGDGVVFLSKDGLYYFNGSYPKRLSAPIYGLFERPSVGVTDLDKACGVVANDTYYLSYNEGNEAATGQTVYPNRVLICNLRAGRWGVRNSAPFIASCAYRGNTAFIVEALEDGTGYVHLVSDWPLRDNLDTGPTMHFGHMDFGYPDQVKVLESVEVWYEALGEVNMTLKVYKEYPPSEPSSAVSNETDTYTATASSDAKWGDAWDDGVYYPIMRVFRSTHNYLKMSGKTFSFTLEVGDGAPEIRLQKIVFNYSVENHPWLGKGVSA